MVFKPPRRSDCGVGWLECNANLTWNLMRCAQAACKWDRADRQRWARQPEKAAVPGSPQRAPSLGYRGHHRDSTLGSDKEKTGNDNEAEARAVLLFPDSWLSLLVCFPRTRKSRREGSQLVDKVESTGAPCTHYKLQYICAMYYSISSRSTPSDEPRI